MKTFITIILLLLGHSLNFAQDDSTSVSDLNDSLKITKSEKEPQFFENRFVLNPAGNDALIREKSDLAFLSYLNTYEILEHLPFAFKSDFGFMGSPHELSGFSSSGNETSYLINGIPINNRLKNNLNLNLLNPEAINSIELSNASRSFLFNSGESNSAVNINTYYPAPKLIYSRIRASLAANEEGFFAAEYSNLLFGKAMFSFFLNHSSYGDSTKRLNDLFSNWNILAQVKYPLSDNASASFDFLYSKAKTGLSGGADTSSGDIFNRIAGNVRFTDRYTKETVYNYNLHLSYSPFHFMNLKADYSYQFFLENYRYNTDITEIPPGEFKSNIDHKYHVNLIKLSSEIKSDFFSLLVSYSNENLNSVSGLPQGNLANNFSELTGIASFYLFDSLLVPSVFAKQSTNSGFGSGADLSYKLADELTISAGFSRYEINKARLLIASEADNSDIVNVFSAGIKYQFGNNDLYAGFFARKYDNYKQPIVNNPDSSFYSVGYKNFGQNTFSGVNLSAKLLLSRILFDFNGNISFSDRKELQTVPELYFRAYLMYKNIHFEDNLEIEAGPIITYNSGLNYKYYNFERGFSFLNFSENGISSTSGKKTASHFRVDLHAAGRIQKRAVLSLTLENLLNSEYFMIPFYPTSERVFRIGLSWEFSDIPAEKDSK